MHLHWQTALVLGLVSVGCGSSKEFGEPLPLFDASTETSSGGSDSAVISLGDYGPADSNGPVNCTPRTCTQVKANCGPAADGCGGLIECGTCSMPGETCGGGGVASQCGKAACTPKTCAELHANCGPMGDGCGGVINCGTCTAPDSCGGGGVSSTCGQGGGTTDGGTGETSGPCVAKTCTQLGASCGPMGDGCGGLLECGACTAPDVCGGGGVPSTCGRVTSCVPRKCADVGANCGPIGDGCGNVLECGTCTAPASCGGGGLPSVCGVPGVDGGTCVPKTCADQNATCGPVPDGCGNILQCGTCTAPESCGGGGVPSRCGAPADTGPTCRNLECRRAECTAGKKTTLSGTVYDPAGKVPLPNVYVYVNNAAVAPITAGATCERCADALSGQPIALAITDVQGKFTIDDVPTGSNVPLVIQAGKWRRQITVPSVTACVDNVVLDKDMTRLPRNKSEGNIPQMALSTGGVDALECLLRKAGIDDAEFTNRSGNGRVHMYHGTPSGEFDGADRFANRSGTARDFTSSSSTLWNSRDNLSKYDVVLLACEAAQNASSKPTTAKDAMRAYADMGGRVFLSHWHNEWIEHGTGAWPTVATFRHLDDLETPVNVLVDQTFPKGQSLAQWLLNVGGSTTLGQLRIVDAQHTMTAVNDNVATRWIYAQNVRDRTSQKRPVAYAPQYLSFNTPVGTTADKQCGRVVLSDIHVSSGDKPGVDFPNGCVTSALSPQELALEFMLFDISSRICDDHVPPPPPPTCVKRTCTQAGAQCGPAADGCGGLLDCGTCTAPDVCIGTPGVCSSPSCTPTTCAKQGLSCGATGDGCGKIINCGDCVAPQTCGGGGVPGVCGQPPTCAPRDCASQGVQCGPAGDGCGRVLDCGTCVAPDTCGGGGTPGVCGRNSSCQPQTCAGRCGPQGDGCGGLLTCPPCPGTCAPRTCAQVGANCGKIGDGCGGVLDCGTCVYPDTCGGGGDASKCGRGVLK